MGEKHMKRLWDKFIKYIAPELFGFLIIFTIVMFLLGSCIWSTKFVLGLLGVL